ncbi:unnamed protein product [Cuscuta epithymum]|uniref:Uncharacterized protein n=1 Tax=Cuscuta epithymum TaxID=186058 RepID=A0AAV0EZP3_9ASTE|nr:unnamed protein product [Cuscuta epithymum]
MVGAAEQRQPEGIVFDGKSAELRSAHLLSPKPPLMAELIWPEVELQQQQGKTALISEVDLSTATTSVRCSGLMKKPWLG